MKCPCNMNVKQEYKNGITIYIHDDGTYCDYLNGFKKNLMNDYFIKEFKEAILNKDEKLVEVYFTKQYNLNYKLVDLIFGNDKEENQRILFCLFTLLANKIKSAIMHSIVASMVEIHGRNILVNLHDMNYDFFTDFMTGKEFSYCQKALSKKSKIIPIYSDGRMSEKKIKEIVTSVTKEKLREKAFEELTEKRIYEEKRNEKIINSIYGKTAKDQIKKIDDDSMIDKFFKEVDKASKW